MVSGWEGVFPVRGARWVGQRGRSTWGNAWVTDESHAANTSESLRHRPCRSIEGNDTRWSLILIGLRGFRTPLFRCLPCCTCCICLPQYCGLFRKCSYHRGLNGTRSHKRPPMPGTNCPRKHDQEPAAPIIVVSGNRQHNLENSLLTR